MKTMHLSACLVMVIVAAVAPLLMGCGGSCSSAGTGIAVQDAAGTWDGTWDNNTFSSTGPASFAITVDTGAQTASITVTLGGSAFGTVAPPPTTLTGPYTGSGFVLNQAGTPYGDLEVSWTPQGTITGNLTNLPAAGISRVDFNGTANAGSIALNYTVRFTDSSTATGTLNLSRI